MEYAQLNESGTDALQITTHGNVEWDENNYCTPAQLTRDGKADQFRVVPLTITEPPAYDHITQSVIRDGCEKVGDAWQYKWRIDDLSPEQIATNQLAQTAATLAAYDKALTDHLDAIAQARRWENRITLMSRAGFPGPWQQDAIAYGTWADTCNAMGYQMVADYQAGLIPLPTIAEVIAALPVMVWPA